MGALEVLFLAFALSMDALAVAVCKGLALPRIQLKHCLTVGLWFGCFQALMPLLGWRLGTAFASAAAKIDHWIAFGLLALIGVNMVREAQAEDAPLDASLSPFNMLLLALATSIDALAAGCTFAFLNADPVPACLLIGSCTFLLSAAGVKLGSLWGGKFRGWAERAGGIVLILLGLRILLQHMGILPA